MKTFNQGFDALRASIAKGEDGEKDGVQALVDIAQTFCNRLESIDFAMWRIVDAVERRSV